MEWSLYLRTVLALIFVLGLIGGAAYLARHLNLGGGARRLASGKRHRRLGVVETLALDGRRRLILVRRDGAEHLLLVGGAVDMVVEAGIKPADEEPAS
jgi:flagellar protein FliO/FliZ